MLVVKTVIPEEIFSEKKYQLSGKKMTDNEVSALIKELDICYECTNFEVTSEKSYPGVIAISLINIVTGTTEDIFHVFSDHVTLQGGLHGIQV